MTDWIAIEHLSHSRAHKGEYIFQLAALILVTNFTTQTSFCQAFAASVHLHLCFFAQTCTLIGWSLARLWITGSIPSFAGPIFEFMQSML
jgi:hypothetical protein